MGSPRAPWGSASPRSAGGHASTGSSGRPSSGTAGPSRRSPARPRDRCSSRWGARSPGTRFGWSTTRATAALLARAADGWLATGDRGYVAEGELYITGRRKDLIIRAGRHVSPYELEELVGALP